MNDRPLVSASDLSEAVHRGLITLPQRDALLALARRDAAPRGRWALSVALVVLAVAPSYAFANALNLDEPARAGVAAGATLLCALAAWVLRARAWARTTAAMLTASAAVYAGALVSALTMMALGCMELSGYIGLPPDRLHPPHFTFYHRGLALEDLAWALVAAALGLALWRRRHNGPALAVVGYSVPFAVRDAVRMVRPFLDLLTGEVTLVGTAFATLLILKFRPAWGRRDGVDGAAWFEFGAFSSAALCVDYCFVHDVDGLHLPWLVVALVAALVGLAARRWTWQVAGALALLQTLAMYAQHSPWLAAPGLLVGAAVGVIATREWQRRRATPRHDVEGAHPYRA